MEDLCSRRYIIIVACGLPGLRESMGNRPFRSPVRIQDIWITPEELEDMVIAKTCFLVDALLEGKILIDDGIAAAARVRLVESLQRLKARKMKHGWTIPRNDLRKEIRFD